MARRAEKKLATRERIIAAATDLFCAKGYDHTTVDEIVTIAGISPRSFFRYFPTKLHVAFPYNEETTRRLEELLRRHQDPSAPLLGVRDALLEYGQWFTGLREAILREWQYVSASPSLVARDAETDRANEGLIARTLEAGGIPGRQARLLAGVIFGGVRATLQEWMNEGCKDDLLVVGDGLTSLLGDLDALVAPMTPRPPKDRPTETGSPGREPEATPTLD